MQVAELVASEFFEQGDVEKNELNLQPIVNGVVSAALVLTVPTIISVGALFCRP